ncbi:hypothetical protein [Neorhodopirellula pilleata]|uniref:hypothetical protein n=1 Tax=Neorhodopirellula pilleata TaxID=2714738 RepID=UPI001E532966|nr:hypothetical protein [Neorhodopirellula pilleata]
MRRSENKLDIIVKNYWHIFVVSFAFVVAGCGSGQESSNVAENAGAKAIADYEAAQLAKEKASNEFESSGR